MAFQLIAITPPYIYEGEAERIAEVLAYRFTRVHIRKPDATADEIKALIDGIPMRLRHRLSLHDHFELADPLGVGGVHLNSRNPYPPEAWSGVLSSSAHDPLAASGMLTSAWKETGKEPDYIFLSPIFPSLSKPGYLPRYSWEEMKGAASQRVIALGGITAGNLPMIEEAGFGGAAMLTDAWRPPLDMNAFRLQFITHPKENLSMVDEARLALEGGCRWIQLRHKDATPDVIAEEATAIAELCRQSGATFIIDDHVSLVKETGADGVHLGKNDMPVAEARRILGPQYIIGATANTWEELQAAAKAGADYAGVGPYRFTTTKQNLAPVLGTEGYREIIKRKTECGIRIPVVAIGGITPGDIPSIMATGVSGIAASGSILNSDNPAAAATHILELTTTTA